MEALKTRLPSGWGSGGAAGPLVRGWAPAWGSLLERFSRSSDAPCAGCGEQQAADGAPDTTSGRSRSCCRSLSEDFLGVTGLYSPHHRQHGPGGAAAGSASGSGRAGLRGQHGGTVR